MTDIDWAAALDDAIDDGPVLRAPAAAVDAGRRALRRRRLLLAGTGAATVVLTLAATVGVRTLVVPDPVGFAGDSSSPHRPVLASTDVPVAPRYARDQTLPAYFDPHGRLVRSGTDVRVDGVYTDLLSRDGSGHWDETAAVAATQDGRTTWMTIRWADGVTEGTRIPARDDMTFDEWVVRLQDEPWLATGGERP